MTAPPSALCLGGLVWDELLLLTRMPDPGTLTSATARSGCVGGVGRCALTLAGLGHTVTVTSRQGRGLAGTLARDELANAAIDCALELCDADLVSTILLVDGERTIIGPPARECRTGARIAASDTPFGLILCATSHTDAFLAASGWGAAATLRSYDAGDRAAPDRVQAAVSAHIVTGRPAFFEQATKLLTGRAGSARDGARALLADGAQLVTITDGAHPVTAYTADGDFTVTPPTVTAVDTTGCGDVFHAALASAISQGRPADAAVVSAVAIASTHAAELGNSALHRLDPATGDVPARQS